MLFPPVIMATKKKFEKLSPALKKFIVTEAPRKAGKGTVSSDVKKSKAPPRGRGAGKILSLEFLIFCVTPAIYCRYSLSRQK